MHFDTPPAPATTAPESGPWFKGLTRYHWFVLVVAALGWLFDTMDQQLFNLAREGKIAEAQKLYRVLTPSFHLDTHVKLVQYIKLAESLVYGAPEWVRSPRLPLVGAERDSVVATIKSAIDALNKL